VKTWRQRKEATTSADQHFGHYKAIMQQPTLSWLLFQRAEIPTISGFSPSRHRHCVDLMIMKKTMSFSVDKQRTLGILESEFNHNNRSLQYEAMRGQIHAHMLAITTDFNIMAQFYTEYACDDNEGKAASTYGEYARNVLSLTGEKPDCEIDTNDNELKPLSTRFCEAVSTKNDLAKLVEDAHMHKCNNFCLRSKKRRCVRCCFSFRKCHNLQSIGQYCATDEFRQFQC